MPIRFRRIGGDYAILGHRVHEYIPGWTGILPYSEESDPMLVISGTDNVGIIPVFPSSRISGGRKFLEILQK